MVMIMVVCVAWVRRILFVCYMNGGDHGSVYCLGAVCIIHVLCEL